MDYEHEAELHNERELVRLTNDVLASRHQLKEVADDLVAVGLSDQFIEDLATIAADENQFNADDKSAAQYRIAQAIRRHARTYVECDYVEVSASELEYMAQVEKAEASADR